ncbi:MAG: DNA-3-methyladenine glycosylase I [Promethearchaeota archaeon]|nr:MAG: DNA-3-methyladenine glycosylase I [Candidatus Lokiarchaeota archaeon]
MERCEWVDQDPLMIKYHDQEWGTPTHDDRVLFELLILEGMQAGLSWKTILNKRENFRKAFDNFDYEKIALYNDQKVEDLLQDKGIIRNRLKIQSMIINAKEFIKIREEFGSFDKFIWNFVNGKPVNNSFEQLSQIPANSSLSDTISKALKKRGFKFIGTTIIYSYLQGIGIVNDHLTYCFRYNEIIKNY